MNVLKHLHKKDFNARNWSDKKLREKLKEYEELFSKTTREFIKTFTIHHYRNFEGKQEERRWFFYSMILIERKKKELEQIKQAKQDS